MHIFGRRTRRYLEMQNAMCNTSGYDLPTFRFAGCRPGCDPRWTVRSGATLRRWYRRHSCAGFTKARTTNQREDQYGRQYRHQKWRRYEILRANIKNQNNYLLYILHLHSPGMRTDSPDNDSAFSDTVSMLSSESSASSSGSGHKPPQTAIHTAPQQQSHQLVGESFLPFYFADKKHSYSKVIYIETSRDAFPSSCLQMRRAERRRRRSAWRWRKCARRACRSSSSKRSRWTAAVRASWSTKGWASHMCQGCSRTRTMCRWIRSGPWSSTCPIFSWVRVCYTFYSSNANYYYNYKSRRCSNRSTPDDIYFCDVSGAFLNRLVSFKERFDHIDARRLEESQNE